MSSERDKARKALVTLDEIDAKRREQLRLQQELRRTLQERAYDQRRASGRNIPQRFQATCATCGWEFLPGEEVIEYVDDNGNVVARYHWHSDECRRASERHPDARMRYT